MTDNDIIKALECCADEYIHSCDYCPFEKECSGDNLNLVKDALDLINRLQAEKEALIAGQETLQKALAEKVAEIERLNKEVDRLSQVVLYHDGHIADARAEATEQLSKKIESRLANNTDISNEQYQSIIWDISEACKEMAGKTK